MNEVIGTIKRRRSVRSYSPEQVKDEDLKALLEAGIYAPSANNTQSWFFTILQDQQMIDKVSGWIIGEARYMDDENARKVAATPNAAIFRRAPTVILVSGDEAASFSRENCACAGQNIMLAAESLGLGSCWICYVGFLANRERLGLYRTELNLPDGYRPFFGITLGYAAGSIPEAHPRRKGVTFPNR